MDGISDKALHQVGKLLLSTEKKLVPKGKTQTLFNALKILGIAKNKKGIKTVKVGYNFTTDPKAFYGIYQEFGRRGGTSKSGRKVSKMEARPYLRPAIAHSKNEAFAITEQVFKEALDEILSAT